MVDKDTDKNTKYEYAHFSVKYAPLWVYKAIAIPAKEYCGDTYWVRIKELLDKEQELEHMRMAVYGLQEQPQPVVQEKPEPEPTQEKEKEPAYLGGNRK